MSATKTYYAGLYQWPNGSHAIVVSEDRWEVGDAAAVWEVDTTSKARVPGAILASQVVCSIPAPSNVRRVS